MTFAVMERRKKKMSDYIKREDAIKLKDVCTDTYADKKYFIEQLKAIPSADVEPVRHGQWIRESVGSDNSLAGYFEIAMAECSECGTCIMGKPNYCPNCGAKMDEKEQEK